jgi:hypothetical protein
VYNGATQTQEVTATIEFEMTEEGFPIFDSVKEPTLLTLDGESKTQTLTKTPGAETSVRIINEKVKVGTHNLVIKVPLTQTVRYTPEGVNSAFWFSDLNDRAFLEAYMPASFEYDQVKMVFEIEFQNLKKQTFYTNGTLTQLSESQYKIEFPSYFNSSSLFYHTAPVGRYPELTATFKSIDGRDIPMMIYSTNGSANLERFKTHALSVLKELEGDYGPFLHHKVVIFEAGSGGMEYCGATMTEYSALAHELTHSYFARGIMPANGNAGWIDEALASWRDKGYPVVSSLLTTTKMAAHPEHTRMTDSAAYSTGARFMGLMDYKFKEKGGLKKFLAELVEKKHFDPLVTEEFSGMLSEFFGESVKAEFDKYIYGRTGVTRMKSEAHPFHQKMSLQDYQNLL